MTLPIWKSEWIVAGRRRRLLALNTMIPLVLVAPIALSAAPAAHAAAVFTVLFALFGTFGSSIPLIRDGESGLLARYALAGAHPGGLILQRVFASAALDVLELIPSIVLIVGARGASPSQVGVLLLSFAAAILTANLLGAWAAAVARSVAEGALFSAVSALLLLHVGGTFRSPIPGSLGAAAERWIPFRPLHESLLDVDGSTGGAGPSSDLLLPTLVLLAGLLLTGALGRYLTVRART